jgi:hypothetical protein
MTIWSSPSAPAFWHSLLFSRSLNKKKLQTKKTTNKKKLRLHPPRLLFGTCCCSSGVYTALHTLRLLLCIHSASRSAPAVMYNIACCYVYTALHTLRLLLCIYSASHSAPAFMYTQRCTLCACCYVYTALFYVYTALHTLRLLFGVCSFACACLSGARQDVSSLDVSKTSAVWRVLAF